MYVTAGTLDDLLNKVLAKLLKSRDRIRPTKGDAVEVRGALLKLSNPRARLSSTETKGTIFSCLGELLWYLSGRNDLESIQYYLKDYGEFAETDGTVHGAYGPRLFGLRGVNQVENVLDILSRDDSRKAVIQLFSAEDITQDYKDVPCTCTMQFFRRGGKLDMFVSMRSNDAFIGMPHDIFCFTMIQEIFAQASGLQVGAYSHAVGSLHLYDSNRADAQAYLGEGWQSPIEMPRMPSGDPWPALRQLIALEEALRKGSTLPAGQMPPFWSDLGSLLQIFALTRGRRHLPHSDLRQVVQLKNSMSSKVYADYIRRRESRVQPMPGSLLELA
jgi:thymidylate synthase|tara:strand:- start:36211 stop:37200 length:990 start_codon:yes stop_codon:yes gene_type:complete